MEVVEVQLLDCTIMFSCVDIDRGFRRCNERQGSTSRNGKQAKQGETDSTSVPLEKTVSNTPLAAGHQSSESHQLHEANSTAQDGPLEFRPHNSRQARLPFWTSRSPRLQPVGMLREPGLTGVAEGVLGACFGSAHVRA